MEVWEYGSDTHTPTLPHSHTPTLPHFHTPLHPHTLQRHRVLDVIDPHDFARTVELDRDHVNPPRASRELRLLCHERIGKICQPDLLARGDGLLRRPIGGAAPRLDFDERELRPVLGDQINLPRTCADIAREDLVTMLLEIKRRDAFCRIPQSLAGARTKAHGADCSIADRAGQEQKFRTGPRMNSSADGLSTRYLKDKGVTQFGNWTDSGITTGAPKLEIGNEPPEQMDLVPVSPITIAPQDQVHLFVSSAIVVGKLDQGRISKREGVGIG